MAYTFRTKRIYDAKAADDGLRVLVDRIWPRGVSNARAALDLWMKDAAPTTELREWFDHRPDRWNEFRRLYYLELRASPAPQKLCTLIKGGPVTLLYAAKDRQHAHALALAAFLQTNGA